MGNNLSREAEMRHEIGASGEGKRRKEKKGEFFHEGERKKMCEGAQGDEMKLFQAEQKSKRRCLNFKNQVQDTKVPVRKVRNGGKEQDQVIRQDVVMAGNIEKVEEDARQDEKKVSVENVRRGDKEHVQVIQGAVVMTDNIVRVEKDAGRADSKVSARKVRSGSKEQDQNQKAVVMADDIEKVEKDARQAENKVLAAKVRGGDKEHVQGFQEVVVMANKIDRAEKDAKPIENKRKSEMGDNNMNEHLFQPSTNNSQVKARTKPRL